MHPQSTTVPAVSGIYRITNTATGDWYIGSSNNIQDRWRRHRGQLRARTHPNRHLQAAWDRDGISALVIAVVEEVAPHNLSVVEQQYLDRECPSYNLRMRAIQCPPLTEEVRAKISVALKGKPHSEEHRRNLATHLATIRKPGTPERCRALAAANIGAKRSAVTRAKMSAANCGRPVSEATRKKIGDANRGRSTHVWTDEQRIRVAEAKREWWRQHKK